MGNISQEVAAEMLALLMDSQKSIKGDWSERRNDLIRRLCTDGETSFPMVRLHRQNKELRDILADLVIVSRKLRHSYECKTERAKNLAYIANSIRRAEAATQWGIPK